MMTTKRAPDVTSEANPQKTRMHTLRVLVLDDEPPMRALVVRFLAAHGSQSAEAGTMCEAIGVMRGTRLGARRHSTP